MKNKLLRLFYPQFLLLSIRLLELSLRNRIIKIRDMYLYGYPRVFPPIKTISTELLLDILDIIIRPGMKICDIGTGSGILAIYAAKKGGIVTATDISNESIHATTINARLNKVSLRILKGDLFEPVKGEKFDLIIFNPPYFPLDKEDALGRAACAGKGYRTIIRFLINLPYHLKKNGICLITLSSLMNVEKILEIAKINGLKISELVRVRGSPGENIMIFLLRLGS